MVAEGLIERRPARYSATCRWNFDTHEAREGIGTAAPLALAALMILAGEVTVRGVVPPEACLEPLPLLDALAERFDLFERRQGSVLIERLDRLD